MEEPGLIRSAHRLAGAALILLIAAGMAAMAAEPSGQTPPSPSLVRLPRKHVVPVRMPEITRMDIDNWASLNQGYNPLGKPDTRVDLHAHDDTSDDIIVYDKTFKRPTQALTTDEIGAEPAGSDAAQPMVPFLGSGCDKGSACVDPGQQGLFSSLPALFGSH